MSKLRAKFRDQRELTRKLEYDLAIYQAQANGKIARLETEYREQTAFIDQMAKEATEHQKDTKEKVSSLETKLMEVTKLANDTQTKNQELNSRMKIMEADSAKGWWARVKGA